MLELLQTLQEEAQATLIKAKDSIQRLVHFPQDPNVIKVAIGMRRSGKTYFLYQTINELLAQGIAQEQILFINFEDDRLLPMDGKTMGQLLDAFYTLYPENHQRTCYIFLDEVQNIPDWHLVVRRYFDSKNVQLYLTGSSAKLLSKEINTSLRGRSLAVNIWPFDFYEYCTAHDIAEPKPPFGQGTYDKMRKHFADYFNRGGFPAVQHMNPHEWRETLQNYVDTVILRDIIERHNVTNIALLKYLTISLLKNAASVFSVNKFFNDVKSQGFKVSKTIIYNYINYLEDAFLIFTVPFYSESGRAIQTRPKKIYAIDSGLIQAVTLNINHAHGQLLENLVYLDLRRKNKKVYYYHTKKGYEVDFVTENTAGKREIIQVTWDASDPQTLAREERALTHAEKELGIKGRIITAKDYLQAYIYK